MRPLGALLAAGALGLLAGFAVPVLGMLAAGDLVLYFLGAYCAHARVRDRQSGPWPVGRVPLSGSGLPGCRPGLSRSLVTWWCDQLRSQEGLCPERIAPAGELHGGFDGGCFVAVPR
ncbi:DoxX family protein [Streptomyces mirabilis]